VDPCARANFATVQGEYKLDKMHGRGGGPPLVPARFVWVVRAWGSVSALPLCAARLGRLTRLGLYSVHLGGGRAVRGRVQRGQKERARRANLAQWSTVTPLPVP
jgi:hypothetical protein